jgi:ComF family protein
VSIRLLDAAPLRVLAPPLCWGCGDVARSGEPLCLPCRRTLHHLGEEHVELAGVATWAPVAYEGPARELVRGLKFRRGVALADRMAALMVANAPAGLLRVVDDADPGDPLDGQAPALVPVPLHPARRRRRGFNQAAVLAEALARRTGLPVADCLSRSGGAGSQVGRPRSARLSAPAGRISAHPPVPGRSLIVDDVATTGATLAACARVLRAAGAREVRAITFARTLGR